MAAERPEKECPPGRSEPLIFLVAGAMLLLAALYVLSIGPVAWLVDYGYLDGDSPVIHAIYAPLAWLSMVCPPLERVLDRYMELFR